MTKLTPMMQQYSRIKETCKDCLLFYRMGDFYELFFDDAIEASKILDIALTKRGKSENGDIPMCGVPFHSADNYLHKLIKADKKVAICEQTETPAEAKKRGYKSVVNREIVRIVTAGTLTEESLLDSKQSNYLAAISKQGNNFSIAWLDISTGEFYYSSTSKDHLNSEISKISPQEILINDKFLEDELLKEIFDEYRHIITTQVSSFFEFQRCENHLRKHYEVATTEGISSFSKAEVSSCGAIIDYVNLTQKCKIKNIKIPRKVNSQQYMTIDFATQKSLEIFSSSNGEYRGSLLHSINKTCTAAGSRMLKRVISLPLVNVEKIKSRADLVELFINNSNLHQNICHLIGDVCDIERITSRLLMGRGGPRDLIMLKNSFFAVKAIYELIYSSNVEIPQDLQKILTNFTGLDKFSDLLDESLREDVPMLARDGGFIKSSFDAKLAELRDLKENSHHMVMDLRNQYRADTSITNLKIQKNGVLGYFVDVSPQHSSKIPQDKFFHRQTLASSVRYSTSELQKLESEINNCDELILQIEMKVFNDLLEELENKSNRIFALAHASAMLDLLSSFATLAIEKGYVRPEISEYLDFNIKAGRHTIVEDNIKSSLTDASNFVPNDCNLEDSQKLWLLTGPNMAGKSTFLRQNAIITILAQIGCFVPAKSATIGIVDRIFSRVGASDDLARGRSTFMVEMVETATILNQATERSLVILDEIGRGTSTFDGLSIAGSCLEYLHSNLKCRGVFATHYHELTALEPQLKNLKCHSMKVKEWQGKVIFMHEAVKGAADKSYGIYVAKLAGLPKSVILRAENLLRILEKSDKEKIINEVNDLPLFSCSDEVLDNRSSLQKELDKLEVDHMTPMQALEEICRLKKLVDA